jgi:diguanylate cyclase (GGDEF)-like protein
MVTAIPCITESFIHASEMSQNQSHLLKRLTLSTLLALGFVSVVNASIILFAGEERSRVALIDLLYPLWNLLATLALLAAAWRARVQGGRWFWGWVVLALAQLSFTVGDGLWALLELGLGLDPFPSAADGFYLLYYPLFFAGILLFPSRRLERLDRYQSLLDIGGIMIAATLGFWIYLLGPLALTISGESWLVQALSLAYPVGDLVLLAAVLRLIYHQPEVKTRLVFLLLGAGALVMIVVDTLYGYRALLDTYQSGGWLDIGWPVAYVCSGMAGLWQARLGAPGRETGATSEATVALPHRLNNRLVYLPYFWVTISFVYLLDYQQARPPLDFNLLASGVGLVIGCVLLRQMLTLRVNDRLFAQLQGAMQQVKQQSSELQLEIAERVRAERQLAYDSLHDALTGLPNRSLFLERLNHAMALTSRRENYGFAVVFLDIDNFKSVNDALGHSVGDQLLVTFGAKLRQSLRMSDTVARLGGDEFVILLEDVGETKDAVLTVRRLQEKVSEPYFLDGRRLHVSASFGIVAYTRDYVSPDQILRDADIAMYQAKRRGKARYEVFSTEMRERTISQLALVNDLSNALKEGQLSLHYQPIFSLGTDQITGLEALIHWQHPQNGLMAPAEFLPLAEELGLIQPIGQWALSQACRQLREWQDSFPRDPALTISVNVSGLQVKQPDFVAQVNLVLQETGLAGGSLILEISEANFLEVLPEVRPVLEALHGMGVQIHIDDFGTGYAALSYLQEYPIRSVKIGAGNAVEIARTIIGMAHDLGKETIAEGIETAEQLQELKRLACDGGQGYPYSQPLDKNRVQKLLRQRSRAPSRQPGVALGRG